MRFDGVKKNWEIIIFVVIAIIAATAAFFISRTQNSPEIQQQNGIEIIEQGNQKIVRNSAEGYQVTIPKDWEVPNIILTDEKIIVQYLGSTQKLETELQDGVYMQVYVFDNPKNLTIQEWAIKEWNYNLSDINIININNTPIFKRIKKVSFGGEDEELVIINDSQVTRFSFNLNKKIYTYTCTARGKNYLLYSSRCEQIAIENIQKLVK